MKKFILTTLISLNCFSHEAWVSLNNYYPERGEIVAIEIASGHKFLSSEKALGDSIIHSFKVITPSQKLIEIKSIKGKNSRKASFKPSLDGLYMFMLELRRPGMDESSVFAQAMMLVGSKINYSVIFKNDIEIKISDPTQSPIELEILHRGIRVPGRITVTSNNGNQYKISTTKKRKGKARLENGIYMLATSYKGQRCSLTFKKGK